MRLRRAQKRLEGEGKYSSNVTFGFPKKQYGGHAAVELFTGWYYPAKQAYKANKPTSLSA
jgi:hypothetical protein